MDVSGIIVAVRGEFHPIESSVPVTNLGARDAHPVLRESPRLEAGSLAPTGCDFSGTPHPWIL